MPDYTVHRYGTDTSGRGIFLTAYMHDWWQGVVAALGFEPVIVQGAFMVRNGGGAAASAGYHDAGGCIDLRTWNLTRSQVDKTVRTIRTHGAAAWRRDAQHGGMDPHIHVTLGADSPLTPGAQASWRSYLDGRDGLASNGPDYEWRPTPLVTTPPQEDHDMADITVDIPKNSVLAARSDHERASLPQALSNMWWEAAQSRRIAATLAGEVRKQAAAVRKAVDANASPAEVKRLLEGLDATIKLVVNEQPEG